MFTPIDRVCPCCNLGKKVQLPCPCNCGGTRVFCTHQCTGKGYTKDAVREHNETSASSSVAISGSFSIEPSAELERELLRMSLN